MKEKKLIVNMECNSKSGEISILKEDDIREVADAMLYQILDDLPTNVGVGQTSKIMLNTRNIYSCLTKLLDFVLEGSDLTKH